jgi:penicillin-binding protein 1A
MIGSGVGAVAKFRASCDLNKLKPVENGQNSFVYASDGSLLGSIPADKNRTRVALRGVSFWTRRATVAIEDHRFYEHGGVDYQGILRAAWSDLRAGHVVQGGSTITQQLVRNLYISKERTFKRKLKEACLAIKLSRRWSKDRILAEYMNQVYYGNHAYGSRPRRRPTSRSTRGSWGSTRRRCLAGLPQAPSLYDPFHRPATALERRDEVLRAMLTYGYINAAQYQHAVSQRNSGSGRASSTRGSRSRTSSATCATS